MSGFKFNPTLIGTGSSIFSTLYTEDKNIKNLLKFSVKKSRFCSVLIIELLDYKNANKKSVLNLQEDVQEIRKSRGEKMKIPVQEEREEEEPTLSKEIPDPYQTFRYPSSTPKHVNPGPYVSIDEGVLGVGLIFSISHEFQKYLK